MPPVGCNRGCARSRNVEAEVAEHGFEVVAGDVERDRVGIGAARFLAQFVLEVIDVGLERCHGLGGAGKVTALSDMSS